MQDAPICPIFAQHHILHAGLIRARRNFEVVRTDERVWKAWGIVEADLGANWSLGSIAQLSNMSPEHFRRLCLKALGRSPMKHLTYLRMRRAAEMLATADDKVETVALKLGYENPFAFSNVFLKWIGVLPSEHRGERAAGGERSS